MFLTPVSPCSPFTTISFRLLQQTDHCSDKSGSLKFPLALAYFHRIQDSDIGKVDSEKEPDDV